jgi:hypothetical protein
MVFNFGGRAPSFDELSDGTLEPLPLGPGDAVRAAISNALPGVDWTDPTWGLYGGNGFSIEFNTGDGPILDGIMLHVRGGGDAIAAMLTFALPNQWSLLDCSTSEFLDPASPSQAGWEGFQAYRDSLFKKAPPPPDD